MSENNMTTFFLSCFLLHSSLVCYGVIHKTIFFINSFLCLLIVFVKVTYVYTVAKRMYTVQCLSPFYICSIWLL